MKNYWWPQMTRVMGRYIKEYNLCQKIKNHIEPPVEKLMANEVP